MKPSKRVICLHSLPATGMAGLKVVQTTLGQFCTPVPTVLLSGLGSHPLMKSASYPFEKILESSLEILESEKREIGLFLGYLPNLGQANFLRDWLKANRERFTRIYVDPICGDDGRLYVEDGIQIAWRGILTHADVAFPNWTELGLITEAGANAAEPAWRQRFPKLVTLLTSAEEDNRYGVKLLEASRNRFFPHPRLPGAFTGTGEYFAANFILSHFILGEDVEQSTEAALNATLTVIERSVGAGARELLLKRTGENSLPSAV